MGSARDVAVKGYIRLPKVIREHTDPIIKNRAKHAETVKRHQEKGRAAVQGGIKRFLVGTKKAVKKI